MNLPTKENIDRWMFDYTEGNLSSEQQILLENFVLDNPDLEVDLDAWKMASVFVEEISYPQKEKAYKTPHILPYIFKSFSALLVITVLLLNYNQIISNNRNHLTQSSTVIKKFINSSSNLSAATSNTSNNKASINNKKQNFEFGVNDVESLNGTNQQLIPPNLFESNISQLSELDILKNQVNVDTAIIFVNNSNQSTSDLNFITNQNLYPNSQLENNKLKTNQLNSFILDGYQVRDQKLLTNEDIEFSNINGVSLKTPKLLSKIEKILSKDIAFSNIPDHTYALPELSDVDVLFSNIGATSKARFYSVSKARWLGNESQQKMSQQFSFDIYSRASKSAFGIQSNYDYYGNGVIQNWDVALLFSPKIAISRNITIDPAIRFKMGNKLLDQSKMINNSQVEYETGINQVFNFDENKVIGNRLLYRDLDAGLTLNTSLFYIGIQSTNLLKHFDNIYTNIDSISTNRASSTTSLICGTQYFSKNEKIVFSPYIYSQFKNQNKYFYTGFSMKLGSLMIGASYGNTKSLTALVGLTTNRFSLFGQTTFAPINKFKNDQLTHQLTLRLNTITSRKARRYITL